MAGWNELFGANYMGSPYDLEIIENCVSCPVKEQHIFCHLPTAALEGLTQITSPAVYPKSAMLFIEGQQPRGVFVLCSGKAKLYTSSREGKTFITKISDHGDILGLNATVSNRCYEVTAEMIEPGQANFIARAEFMRFLRENAGIAMRVMEHLSQNYYSAYESIRTLGLATSPSGRFAQMLLACSAASQEENGNSQVNLKLTHQEISELLGVTRETVSRLFSEFRRKDLLRADGRSISIPNKPALERMLQA
jgi:CRP/FNR family cyclic AMP-dependent transcriptional regulator